MWSKFSLLQLKSKKSWSPLLRAVIARMTGAHTKNKISAILQIKITCCCISGLCPFRNRNYRSFCITMGIVDLWTAQWQCIFQNKSTQDMYILVSIKVTKNTAAKGGGICVTFRGCIRGTCAGNQVCASSIQPPIPARSLDYWPYTTLWMEKKELFNFLHSF